MPDTEGTVKYRVELDDSDIGAQLDSIREKIDTALGTTSFNPVDVAKVTPTQLPFPEIPAAPPPSNFANQLDSQFWQNVNSTAGSDVHGAINRIGEKIDYVMAGMYGGVNRAVQDFQGFFPGGSPYMVPQQPIPGMTADPGLWNDVLRAYTPFSGGFSYTGAITPGEMRRQAADRMSDRLFNLTTDYGITAGATAAGFMVGGPVGALTGFSVGTTVDFVQDLLSRRAVEREQLATGLLAVSRTNGARMGKEDALDFATELQTMFSSVETRARGFDITSAETAIVQFANAGGYTSTRGADDFKRTTLELLANYKQIAADLNIAFEDAQQYMGMLNKNFIANPSQAAGLSARIKGIAALAGTDPAEIASFAMEGAISLGGAGLGRGAGYQMALDSRYQAERLAQYGNLETRQMVADAGGPAGFAGMMMSTLTNWGMGNEGMLSIAAMLGGYNGSGGLGGLLGGAAGFIGGDPMRMFALQAQQAAIVGQLGAQGMDVLNLMALDPMVKIGKMIGAGSGPEGKIPADVLAGIIMSMNPGMNAQQAFGMVRSALTEGPSHEQMAISDAVDRLKTQADIDGEIPWYSRLWYGTGGKVTEWLDSFEGLNRLRGDTRRRVRDFGDYVHDTFTRSRTIRNEDIIRDASLQKSFGDFQNSEEMKDIEQRVDTIMNNFNTDSGQNRLRKMAFSQLETFYDDARQANRESDIPFLNVVFQQYPNVKEAYAMNTLGMGFEDRLRIAKELHKGYREGETATSLIYDLQHRTGVEGIATGYDRNSDEYKKAFKIAQGTRIDPNSIHDAASPEEVKNTIAQQLFGQSYDKLSSNYKAALLTVAESSPKLSRMLGSPVEATQEQYRSGIRLQLLREDSAKAKADAERMLQDAKGMALEAIPSELEFFEINLQENPYLKSNIIANVEKIFSDLHNRGLDMAGEFSPERIRNRAQELLQKGYQRTSAETEELIGLNVAYRSLEKIKKGGPDLFQRAIHLDAMAQVEKNTQDSAAASRLMMVADDDTRAKLLNEQRKRQIGAVMTDTPDIQFGQIPTEEAAVLINDILKNVERGGLTDKQIAAYQKNIRENVSLSELLKPGQKAALGMGESLEVTALSFLNRMTNFMNGKGIPVNTSPGTAKGGPLYTVVPTAENYTYTGNLPEYARAN